MRTKTIDKRVKCDFCGKEKKESASIYVVVEDRYWCSQKCLDKTNELIRPHTKGRV